MEGGNQMKKNAEKIRKLGVFLTICVSAAVMVGCGKGQESEETEKLTTAVIGSKGAYVYYAATNDNAKAKEILSSAF